MYYNGIVFYFWAKLNYILLTHFKFLFIPKFNEIAYFKVKMFFCFVSLRISEIPTQSKKHKKYLYFYLNLKYSICIPTYNMTLSKTNIQFLNNTNLMYHVQMHQCFMYLYTYNNIREQIKCTFYSFAHCMCISFHKIICNQLFLSTCRHTVFYINVPANVQN